MGRIRFLPPPAAVWCGRSPVLESNGGPILSERMVSTTARLPGDWAFPITNVALYRFDDWILSDGQMLDRSCLGTPPMVKTQIAMHQNRVAVNSERGDLTWRSDLLERITSTQMMKAVSPQRRTISKCDRPSGLTINAPAKPYGRRMVWADSACRTQQNTDATTAWPLARLNALLQERVNSSSPNVLRARCCTCVLSDAQAIESHPAA